MIDKSTIYVVLICALVVSIAIYVGLRAATRSIVNIKDGTILDLKYQLFLRILDEFEEYVLPYIYVMNKDAAREIKTVFRIQDIVIITNYPDELSVKSIIQDSDGFRMKKFYYSTENKTKASSYDRASISHVTAVLGSIAHKVKNNEEILLT